jgi:hypothetical protein
MPDFLDEKRQEIAARLKKLKPLVEEHGRLEAAARALDGAGAAPRPRGASSATAAPSSRKRGRPRGSKATSTTATATKTTPAKTKAKGRGKAGRRKGTGIRTAEALAFIKESPGITNPELAERMGIQSTSYLYRVLPNLEGEGKIEKKGRGWHPAGAA